MNYHQPGILMRKRAVALSLLLLASLVPFCQAQNAASQPLAVVTLSSYDELKQDINFLGSLAGQDNIAAQFEPFIVGFTQGLDKTKPLGLVVNTGGAMGFSGALCLPIADIGSFLKNLQAFGITTTDAGGGLTQITAQGQNLFAKQGNGWSYLSMMPDMLQDVPADPATVLSELTSDYDIGLRAHLQNIPEPFKQQALAGLRQGMEANMKKLPDESDEQFQSRKEMAEVQVQQLERLLQEVDQLTFGLSLDNKKQSAYVDVAYTALAGSKLAEQIASSADVKTNFAGFNQPDAAGMMLFGGKALESDVAQTVQMIDAARQQAETAIDKESDLKTDEAKTLVKEAINDFLDAVVATIKSGSIDGGAVFHVSPDSLSLVAGGYIADPAKIESGLKKLVEVGKEQPHEVNVQWNADSHQGVEFHTLTIPIPTTEKESRQLFGNAIDIAVGIGKDSVYFTMGRDCLDQLKKVIDESAASPDKAISPMEMSLSLRQILTTAAAFDKNDQGLQMVASALNADKKGLDHVRIKAEPIENGVRSRLEVEEGVLRAIGTAAKAQQMQAMGAAR